MGEVRGERSPDTNHGGDAGPGRSGNGAPDVAEGRESTSRGARGALRRLLASRRAGRWERIAALLAGPALVVVAVLVVHHAFVFGGMVTNQQVDILAMWTPTHCLLGKSLAAGHILAWNPYTLAGAPFAADPQSGWTYLPAMLLYWLLPCHTAITWFITLQPILAGLGIYGFLRGEETSRVAATVGGVALALTIAGSALSLELPFSGTLAWTAVTLCAASWYLRASTWPRRLALAAAAALSWGQIANAHFSHGLVLGTGILLAYLVGRLGHEVLARRRPPLMALGSAGLLLVALPIVNLAVLLPRLAYLPHTSIGLGYQELDRLGHGIAGLRPKPFRIGAAARSDPWPLALVSPPGTYVGAVALALAPAALWHRRRLGVAWALAVFTVLCWVLSLKEVARWLEPTVSSLPLGDFYLHAPVRFGYGVLLGLGLLAGLGADAWLLTRAPVRRLAMLIPGVIIWGVLPPAYGLRQPDPWLVVSGAVLGAGVLLLIQVRPTLAWTLPILVAVELTASGLLGQATGGELPHEGPRLPWALRPLPKPQIDAAAYTRAGRIALALRNEETRFLPVLPGTRATPWRISRLGERVWGLLANQRGMIFGLHDAIGYNPTELVGYWKFVRAAAQERMRYNAVVFRKPPPIVLNLLAVDHIVAPARKVPVPGARGTGIRDGRFELYEVRGPRSLLSLVPSWVVEGESRALADVTTPGFDPDRNAVVQRDPGIAPGPGGGDSSIESTSLTTQRYAATVSAGQAELALVRIPFDRDWHAAVDGRPAPVVPADGAVMAVPIPPGTHELVMSYDDPTIGYGLLGSAVTLGGLLVAPPVVARVVRRRRGRRAAPS